MTENQRWVQAVEPAAPRPSDAGEFITVLDQLAGLASKWSEVLDGLRGSAQQYGGPTAGISFGLACRRAEQTYIELQIALRQAQGGYQDAN